MEGIDVGNGGVSVDALGVLTYLYLSMDLNKYVKLIALAQFEIAL